MTDSVFAHDAPAARCGLVSRAARWVGSAFLAAGLLAGSNGVLAANADLKVTVTPIPNVTAPDGTLISSAVSLSRLSDPLSVFNAYLALQVKITSAVTNTNNAVVFRSSVNVDAGASAPAFKSVVGTACLAGSTFTDTQFTCNIGQMRGGTSVSFVVIFRTPANGTAIDFPWTLSYSTPGSQGSNPSGTDFSGSAHTDLITAPAADVSTKFTTYVYVPPGQLSEFFNGTNNGTATSTTDADKLTTKVAVPSNVTGLATISVQQTHSDGGLSNDTLTTNETTISIPAAALFSGGPITIQLQRDSSTIRSFQGIDRAPLYYQTQGDDPIKLGTPLPDGSYPFLPLVGCTVGEPNSAKPVCIDQRIPLTKKNASGQDVGDWRFILKALQNGVSKW